MQTLPLIAYILAAFGVLIGAAFAAAVLVDVWLATTGRQTISEWFMTASQREQGVVAAIAVAFGFVWGGLVGHLVWYRGDHNFTWLLMVGLVIVGLCLGVAFGHKFFGQ